MEQTTQSRPPTTQAAPSAVDSEDTHTKPSAVAPVGCSTGPAVEPPIQLPIQLPEGDEHVILQGRSLEDWTWIANLRSLRLPLPEHRRLQEVWVNCLYVPTKRDRDFAKAIGITQLRSSGTKRRWLAVNGTGDIGKTDLAVNFGINKLRLGHAGFQYRNGHRQLPVLFIEANKSTDGLTLLRAMCEFAGMPDTGKESDIRKRLNEQLPAMGTSIVIVDDAHMLSRTSPRSTTLTNNLRAMLRLPVTFVFIGAGIQSSALLQTGVGDPYASARQLRQRAEELDLLPLRDPNDRAIYDDLVRGFARRVRAAIPDMKFSGIQRASLRAKVLAKTGGSQGTMFALLKDATNFALDSGDRDVTADLIERLLPPGPGVPHKINPDDWPDDLAACDVG